MGSAGPRDATAFEVRAALRQSGCAICRLSVESVKRFIKSVAYEQVNDLDLRKTLRRAGGFCNAHAHQWLAEAQSTLGTAIIYRDVLRAALHELEAPPTRSAPPGGRIRGLLGGSGGHHRRLVCPACQAQTEAESRYLDALLALVLADEPVLDGSDGLCRRHALAAIRASAEGGTKVAQRTCEVVERLIADLDEVIRKEDYRFRDEPRTDAERSAPARAITWAAGLDGMASP